MVGASVAHLVTVPSHLRTWPASGVFFAALALAQAAMALVLFRNRFGDRLVGLALWGTVGVIGLYLLSRTVTLPFVPLVGAHGTSPDVGRAIIPGAEKRVQQLDALTLVVEVMAVVTLASLLSPGARRRAVNLLLAVGVGLWALAATTII
ncbi:MAG: hypothetical protein ACKV2O_19525 [Acidimicrobiales bacterium]